MQKSIFFPVVAALFAGGIITYKAIQIDESHRTRIQSYFPTNDSVQAIEKKQNETLSFTNTVYPSGISSGTIGCDQQIRVDNPRDNEFRFILDDNTVNNANIQIEYELYGVKNSLSVCKSINDQISSGGLFVQLSSSWSHQIERVPNYALKAGTNIIRFSIPDGLEYTYRIKDIRLKIDYSDFQKKEIVVNQSGKVSLFSNHAYLTGYIAGAKDQSCQLLIDNKPIFLIDNTFDCVVDREISGSNSNDAILTAIFPDGSKIIKRISFINNESYDLSSSEFANYRSVSKYAQPENDFDLSIVGFNLLAPAKSIKSPVNISVSSLRLQDMPLVSTSLINVTYQNAGYRCLPHGTLFTQPIPISIRYDSTKIPAGYSAKDIRTYYYDEERQQWEMLELDSIDQQNAVIISKTNHFTDFINGILKTPEAPLTQAFTPTTLKDLKAADPLAGFSIMSPPTANNMGSADLSLPIEIPAGRGGMQPQLNISYSSERGNGLMGIGWGMSLPAITVETRWGVPAYLGAYESESYLLNGEELLPQVNKSSFVARSTAQTVEFFPKVEGAFNRIIRHGTSTANYWWEVIDKQGVKYYYGKYSTDSGPNSNCILTDNRGNIAHWALAEVRDLNDNYVKYNYQVTHNAVSSSPASDTREILPTNITYTGSGTTDGKYKIEFVYNTSRPDYYISSRYGFPEITDQLLHQVVIKFNNNYIHSYFIKYKTGSFGKMLVCFIADLTNSSHVSMLENQNCDDEYIGEVSGCKIHRYQYYEQDEQAFSDPVNFASGEQDAEMRILDGLMDVSMYPSLSQSLTTGWSLGGSIDLGLGANTMKKNNSIGGNITYSENYSTDYTAFFDINGDGLPDRVFKNGDDVYYRALRFVNQTDLQYDATPIYISSLTKLGKSSNWALTGGLEGQLGLSDALAITASVSWAKAKNKTSRYFADVNGDGYPDFIDNYNVYYNALYDENNPQFIEELPGSIQPIPGSGCDFIIRENPINDSVYTPLNDQEFDERYGYTRDAVRMWKAPFSGEIVINSNVKLIEDSSFSRLQSHDVDGVVYSIQDSSTLLHWERINASDYANHQWTSGSRQVIKGQRIYFRLQSREDRKWDDVYWDPIIHYTIIGGTNIDSTKTDAEGKKIAVFRASDDVLIYQKESFIAPYPGKIRIRGTLNVNQVSDTVRFKIIKGNTVIRQISFNPNTTVNYYSSDTLSILADDSIRILAYTRSNVDWNKISNNYLLYYYHSDSISIDTNSQFNKLEYMPILQYNMYPNTLERSVDKLLSTGTWTIQPQIGISGSINCKIVFSAKQNNQVIFNKVLEISNGSIVGNPTFTIINSSTNPVYFDYYIDSLGDHFFNAGARLTKGLIRERATAGLHTVFSPSMRIFGNLYRGWGQFSYEDDDTTSNSVIDESELHLSVLSQDTSLITFNPNNISDFGSAQYEMSASGANDPLKCPFNPMFPDLKSNAWWDYAQMGKVGKDCMSNTTNEAQLAQGASQDTVYDSPLWTSIDPNVPVRTIKKSWVEKTFAYSVGATIGIAGLNYAHNKTKTSYELDYLDLNGDRYPDVVGAENVQYTMPQGGYRLNIVADVMADNVAYSEYVGEGYSLGVNHPITTKSNVPLGTMYTGDSKTPVKSVQGSLSEYNGNSNTFNILLDINGDGLPDKIDDAGNVYMNLGFSFGPGQNWGFSTIQNMSCISDNISLGFAEEYNSSQYSWSGGVNACWSKSNAATSFIDINGDGFNDLIYTDFVNNNLTVSMNTGHGFASNTTWSNSDSINSSKSLAASAYLSGTAGFTICSFLKIVANLQASVSGSGNYQKLVIEDFNNDGYPDIITANPDGYLSVRFSKLGKINLLKSVTTPTQASYIIDYNLSTCNQKMPQRRYQMSSLKVFDAFVGDGQDTTYYKFNYSHGYYDRINRDFYGYDSVTSIQYNNFSTTGVPYRSTIEKYHNTDYLFKGLKNYEATVAGLDQKYIVKTYKYDKKEIKTGKVVNADSAQCYGPYYPAISYENTYYYEGQNSYQIHTKTKYIHGRFGNIIKVRDYGDVADPSDDVFVNITYSQDTTKNLLAMVDSLIVLDTAGNIYRKRAGEYNSNGMLTAHLSFNGSSWARTDISYDSDGNIKRIELPANSNNQRCQYDYNYDNETYTYPIMVTDVYGNYSEATYDYRFGLPLTVTDISGNQMIYTYYNDGKAKTVTGPKEIASGANYTIKFEYSDELYPFSSDTLWARTKHFDSISGGDFLTLTTVDGLGRVVQQKKTATENGNLKWFISGKSTMDSYGRPVSVTLPTSCDVTNVMFYNHFPVTGTSTTYDCLDRIKYQTFPDQTTTSIQYGFDYDAYNISRFATTVTDPNGIESVQFTSPKGLKTSITNALNTITKFEFNPVGELIKSVDPEGNETDYTYNMAGQLLQRIHPDAGITSYSYDDAGNLMSTITANLAQTSQNISYVYDYNRLIEVHYPENPENDVYYEYGDPQTGNQSGRLVKMQDASGVQTYQYGNMGELIRNVHTYFVPGGNYYTFETNWKYDSWNRLLTLSYPDGERVSYHYNNAGQLESMDGLKGNDYYPYIDSIKYDIYGKRNKIIYGNGTYAMYTYDNQNQLLQNLKSYDVIGKKMQDINYSYDNSKNITSISNDGNTLNNNLGGVYNYNFTYDDLYRLTIADGEFTSANFGNLTYAVEMSYSASGNINKKETNVYKEQNGNLTHSYFDNSYTYSNAPHQVSSAGNTSYRWDLNGNMINRLNYPGNGDERILCWDEENRLTTVLDKANGETAPVLSAYIYNASGERTWKLSGVEQEMLINGQNTINWLTFDKTLYQTSSLMVMTDAEYTKHYYIEGERICSKIGSGFELAPTEPTGEPMQPLHKKIDEISTDLWQLVLRGVTCVNYKNTPQIGIPLKSAENNSNNFEADLYFYHSDHIGSASFVTDINGEAIQHLQYMPFGESFIDQRSTSFSSRYSFSAKEKDMETDYSYFGARYYDSDLSVWLSVDPLADKYPSFSPFNYCENNPVILTDPTGLGPDDWFLNEVTGDVTYDSGKKKGDEALLGENWKWLGENGMMGETKETAQDQIDNRASITNHYANSAYNYTSTDINGNSTNEIAVNFKGDKAVSFMNAMGFSLVPSQATEYKMESTSRDYTPGGMRSFTFTPIHIIIIEKFTYIRSNQTDRVSTTKACLSNSFILSYEFIGRYTYSYSEPKYNYTNNSWYNFLSGTFSDSNKPTIILGWKNYNYKNKLINTFVMRYGQK
jgi:RHS repeat-associated protein